MKNTNKYLDDKYHKLYDELNFTRELLGLGLTNIRKANFQNKGIYLQAFSNLSLGLERMMKVCCILQYYSTHKKFPNSKEIKKYGHDLEKLFSYISSLYPIENKLTDIHYKILSHLSEFASGSGTRYSNINFIGNNEDNDPIYNWHKEIDIFIYEHMLTARQKKSILDKIQYQQSIYRRIVPAFVFFVSEENKEILDTDNLTEIFYKISSISGYRVLLIIEILEYIFNILEHINNKNSHTDYFLLDLGRLFATFFYGSNTEKRTRKDFTRL